MLIRLRKPDPYSCSTVRTVKNITACLSLEEILRAMFDKLLLILVQKSSSTYDGTDFAFRDPPAAAIHRDRRRSTMC
jgi:hypothetical protein